MASRELRRYHIAAIPGDGIGKEVCDAALQVLESLKGPLRFTTHPAGAECYMETGDAFPPETLDACLQADAILHGAAGLPNVLYDDGTEAGQDFSLNLRRALDLFANIRPIRLYEGVPTPLARAEPGRIDYVIVRENTEGLYAARGGGNVLSDRLATDTMITSAIRKLSSKTRPTKSRPSIRRTGEFAPSQAITQSAER